MKRICLEKNTDHHELRHAGYSPKSRQIVLTVKNNFARINSSSTLHSVFGVKTSIYKRFLHRVGTVPVLLAASSGIAFGAEKAEKPNIIFIMTDDIGIGDVGCYGGPFTTPNIDELARTGIRFEYSYSAPVSGPSRCQALTGRYPFRTGLNSNDAEDALAGYKEIMIPTVLKTAGYTTACVGKWGQIPYGPREWGFDETLSFIGNGKYTVKQLKQYEKNGTMVDLLPGEYLPDLMHNFAADFIEKNKNKSFFLYYSFSHIHGPIVPTPDSQPGADEAQLYTDNISYTDKLVGQIVAKVKELNLTEKTLIIFTGDNGTARFGLPARVNGYEILGGKGTLLEGGSRVPLIVNWKGTTPSGRVNKDLTDFSDFFGTIAEIAGASLPQGVIIDSRSFAPQIKGMKGEPREWCYVEFNGKSYVRDYRYKLTNKGEFFDLKNAPFEEIPITLNNTCDKNAASAKEKLQQVLNEHPAVPGRPKASQEMKKRNIKKKKDDDF